MAWCLELCSKDEGFWIISLYVQKEWCLGLAYLLMYARPGKGFMAPGGDWLHVREAIPPLRLFFLRGVNQDKEVCRDATIIGLEEIKKLFAYGGKLCSLRRHEGYITM